MEVFTRVDAALGAAADINHVHLRFPAPAMRALASSTTPLAFTAHVPVCPNGARYLYADRRPCASAVGAACVKGYFKHGCGHLSDRTATNFAAFSRSIWHTARFFQLLNRTAAVLAPSSWQKTRLEADGVRPELIHVLPPPIRVSSQWKGWSEDEEVVVAASGRLVDFKGFDHLLKAAAAARVNVRVHVIGDGPERGTLERLAGQLGVADKVLFHGRKDPLAAQKLVAAADAFVVSSLWPETYHMAGAEAAAMNVPTLVYGYAGVLEWAAAHSTTIPLGRIDLLAAAIEQVGSRRRSSAATPVDGTDGVARHCEALASIYYEISRVRPRQS